MIKNFTITKQDNQGKDNLPNRKISTKIGDNFIQIGSGWVKNDKNGNPFISGQLKNEFVKDDGMVYDGYVIITEREYKHLKNCEARCQFLTSPTDEFPAGIDLAKHPLNSDAEQANYDKTLEDIGF